MGLMQTVHVNKSPAKHYLPWALYTLLYVSVDENSINNQAKKEKLRILKLRTITWEADSQKPLKTVPPVRSERQSQIHFRDKESYIKMTD